MRYPGKLYVLEGVDGTGKSTQAKQIVERFGLTHFREPGSVRAAEAIRATVLTVGDLSPEAQALLYIAARTEFVKQRLIPALIAGENVLMERYYFSTMVYQHGALPWDVFNKLHAWMPKPDKVILLEVDPETAIARDANPHENQWLSRTPEYFRELSRHYRNAIKGYNASIVNANVDFDTVQSNIVRALACENPHIFG
jgi:dTMP kinase